MSARPKANHREGKPLVLHSIPAAAARLDCSVNHVYRLIASGDLRAVETALPTAKKSKTRVRSDDIDAWIKAHTRTAVSAHGSRDQASPAA